VKKNIGGEKNQNAGSHNQNSGSQNLSEEVNFMITWKFCRLVVEVFMENLNKEILKYLVMTYLEGCSSLITSSLMR
jgi:hypothetical protein